ncbi:MAG: sensor histidine kinase [Campylobacterales bacterium]|nr:sensor histidine kinase [Campylobacterales bacterium]
MKKLFEKTYETLLLKLQTLTIKQANVFTTLFILLFTIIFADLLITENYHDYERALYTDKLLERSYLDLLEHHEEREKKLKALLIKNTVAIATLAFILFAIMIGFYKIFNTLLQRDMQAFLDFFKSTAHNEQVLNPNTIFFAEFKKMVGYANEMVETINEQKKDLKELNLKLEDKVQAKTSDLVETNKKLLEEKRFSEEILQSQKEFLRHTIHETNTPLSVMLTSIEMLTMQNEKSRHLSKIEAAAKNLFNIYDDLSYLVKKDQVDYPRAAVEINSYVHSRIDFFSEVAQLSKLSFTYSANVEEDYVYFNETKLQRIIDNTITNAIKYTLADELINVKVESQSGYVDVSVGSKSKEIKDKEKVFEAFYREHSSDDGFGIGLRLVKSICEEEDVAIFLDSTDRITTFRYRFKVMGR